jgi:FtsH-binding integral membrane protein
MDISRIFFIYAIIVGLIVGGVIVLYPQSRDFAIAPYFWVLIAFGAFELVAFSRQKESGPPITGTTRIVSFAIALGLMVLIPVAAGMPLRIF